MWIELAVDGHLLSRTLRILRLTNAVPLESYKEMLRFNCVMLSSAAATAQKLCVQIELRLVTHHY